MVVLTDTPRNLTHFDKIRLMSPYPPDWFKAEDFSSCKISVDTLGSIVLDYFSGHTSRRRVALQTFGEFVEWMTKTRHTFICNTTAEVDACINLCSDLAFKLALCKHRSAVYNGLTFTRTAHKLNIREGNKWWHVWDVSDVSRAGAYSLRSLNDAEEIRTFTADFLSLCLEFGLIVSSELSWSSLAQNFLMRNIVSGWPDWDNPTERGIQFEFYQWAKSSYHSSRTLGHFVGTRFDGVRSHLSILYNLPDHSAFYSNYKKTKTFCPGAAYGLYKIRTKLPELAFLPWRMRISDSSWGAFYEVHGEQEPVVTQQELEGVMEVLDFKEDKDFQVLEGLAVVPRKESYPYRRVCGKILELLEDAPKESHVKSMYHRFVGKMFQVIEGDSRGLIVASSAHTFDPMVAATVWATERIRVWKTLMSSKDPHYTSMDGGNAESPTLDGKIFKERGTGEYFGYGHQLRDDLGENDLQLLVAQYRDSDHIEVVKDIPVTIATAARCEGVPFSSVGTTRPIKFSYRPGYVGRARPDIKRVGELLERTVTLKTLLPEEALARFEEDKKERLLEWLTQPEPNW